MGLDTRAFRKATPTWREEWVERTNAAGERPAFFGLAMAKLEEPVTVEEAPLYHQENMDSLDWPGGLCGGMISGQGDAPSFRGKVYDSYVEKVTGQSLYAACDEMWEGTQLAGVAAALRSAAEQADENGGLPQGEREALARWFEVCVENDLVVGGDY